LKKTIQVEREKGDLFWMTVICVSGPGFRTAIEVIFMALEAGLIEEGRGALGDRDR